MAGSSRPETTGSAAVRAAGAAALSLSEACKTGFREIRTNKFRSVLSFAAIAVGVASLIYTLAQVKGMQDAMTQAMDLLGPGRMEVERKRDYVSRGLSRGLTTEDADAIRSEVPGLYMVYPLTGRWGATVRDGKTKVEDAYVQGITPEWRKRDWVYTLSGRFLNDWDVRRSARVCVVIVPGGWVKKPFWASFWSWKSEFEEYAARHDLLGRDISIEGRLFTVVGTLKNPPRDEDPRWFSWNRPGIVIPVSTFQRVLGNQDESAPQTAVDSIVVDTGSRETVGKAKSSIAALLKSRHRGEEDFDINDSRDMIENELAEAKKWLIAAIILGGVALFAGGIGIMNVTLAIIFSRIKEIGIRRALGASKLDIMAQFLVEAALLGLAGGLAGIGLGVVGLSTFAKAADRDVAAVAWYHGLIGMAVAALVAALFALYPAYQASKLDPVDALRSE
ncbi:MAG: ABC transporter permease [Elusimicrobia bacterium]|nr:ABC transporter permease [Elusimicrobiota bacterium]